MAMNHSSGGSDNLRQARRLSYEVGTNCKSARAQAFLQRGIKDRVGRGIGNGPSSALIMRPPRNGTSTMAGESALR